MNDDKLLSEISWEISCMREVCKEVRSIHAEWTGSGKPPDVRDRTAAGAFMAQFYNGIENILKRIIRENGSQMPSGDDWHIRIVRMFKEGEGDCVLPLFDGVLFNRISMYRSYRHIVRQSYGFQLSSDRLIPGMEQISETLDVFEAALRNADLLP